ncbi:MAG: CPBP family intramembrane glutamic endopeptidase [Tumebacillaceae bacterium]
MPFLSRRLLWAAGIGLLLSVWYLFLRPDPYVPFRPNVQPEQAKQVASSALQEAHVATGAISRLHVTQEENAAAEQYLQQVQAVDAFQRQFGMTEPLVYWKVISVDDPTIEIWVNQKTGRVEAMRGLPLAMEAAGNGASSTQVLSYLKKRFASELAFVSTSQLGKGKVLTTYRTDGGYKELQDVIEVETTDGHWTGFTHRMVAPRSFEAAREAAKPMEELAGLFDLIVLLFPLVGLYVFLFRAKLMVGMRWGVPIAAGGLTMLAIGLQAGNMDGMGEGLLYGASVVVVMQMVYRGQLDEKTLWLSEHWTRRNVVLGYCLFGVQAGVGVLFAYASERLGGWTSVVQGKEMIALSSWPLLLPLATGVAASIFEELVYRKFADVWVRRFVRTTWLTGLLSSVLWALGHLGYDVAPWYLRIIELGLVVGPLSFWMYRMYGLFPAILAHFLYNVLVTCHELVGYAGASSGAVYLYLLTPLLLLVVPRLGNNRLIR